MSTEAAAILAMSLNFITIVVVALWLVVPWARSRTLSQALVPLVLVHAGRTVALQLYSAQANGYDIPDSVRNEIIWGDQVGSILAIATLVALWRYPTIVRPMGWTLVIATVIDLANALIKGINHELLGKATDVSWLILTFYVPVLWVSIALVAWQLSTRRPEPT